MDTSRCVALLFVICQLLTTSAHYFFFFNDTATTEIYTLSLHDALPILDEVVNYTDETADKLVMFKIKEPTLYMIELSRSEGTRLNSSHANISYAVFCLKKKTSMSCSSSPLVSASSAL